MNRFPRTLHVWNIRHTNVYTPDSSIADIRSTTSDIRYIIILDIANRRYKTNEY